ncbi:MAG: hypothetical protein ACI92Z_002471 [Paracoccaceae bacterium]|jgi:hypothetical protein
MAYTPAKIPVLVLNKPLFAGVIVLFFGMGCGTLFQSTFANNLFERFGALNVALGVFLFGTVASELMVRGKASLIVGADGEPGEPFKLQKIRRALNVQAAVVTLGTIQWGFGGLLVKFVERY